MLPSVQSTSFKPLQETFFHVKVGDQSVRSYSWLFGILMQWMGKATVVDWGSKKLYLNTSSVVERLASFDPEIQNRCLNLTNMTAADRTQRINHIFRLAVNTLSPGIKLVDYADANQRTKLQVIQESNELELFPKGNYATFLRNQGLTIAVATDERALVSVLSFVINIVDDLFFITDRNTGTMRNALLCSEVYKKIGFKTEEQAACYLAMDPIIWQGSTHTLRKPSISNMVVSYLIAIGVVVLPPARRLPTPAFSLAKDGDFLVEWPTQESPQGSIIKKTSCTTERISEENMNELTYETLSIEQLEELNKEKPSPVLTTLISLWHNKALALQLNG